MAERMRFARGVDVDQFLVDRASCGIGRKRPLRQRLDEASHDVVPRDGSTVRGC